MNGEQLAHYSRALDEIYRLRAALAYEARVLEVHLEYKTFPKGRRESAEQQVERMREAARSGSHLAYREMRYWEYPESALKNAGAPTTLTRAEWEAS